MRFNFLLILVSFYVSRLAQTASIGIYSVSTHPFTENYNLFGSMKGGTLLYLKGLGFDIYPANNYIMLGSNLCDIEYSSENYIRCYTPEISSTEEEVNVTIEFKNYNGEVISECWATDCTFVYKRSATPIIEGMYPRTVSAQSTLHITGLYQMTSSSQYRYTKFYDRVCQATNLGSIAYSSQQPQTVQCIVSQFTPSGMYNGSFVVSQGAADVEGYGITVDSHQLFDVRIVPEISRVNGNYASQIGKIVEIEGVGFGDHSELINVEVEGVQCQLVETSKEKILCQMPEISPITGDYFRGALGLKLKHYSMESILTPQELRDTILLETAVMSSEEALPELEILTSSSENYAAQAYGYFRAARTGDYKFYISCQGACELYFQETPDSIDRASMTMIANAQDTPWRYYFVQETQISQTFTLTEGNYYYLEVYHTKEAAGAQLTVSVEIPSDIYRINSIVEKVQLSVDSEIELEKFWISIYGQTDGNWTLLYLDYEDPKITATFPWNATCDDIVPEINKFGVSVLCEQGKLDSEGNLIVEVVPEESTPEESTPEESTPEESTPEESTPEESTPEESTSEESTPTQIPVAGWIYNITFLKRREVEIKLVPQIQNLITDGTITAASNWWNHVSDPVTGTFTLSLDGAITQINCNATTEEMKSAFINDLLMPETIEVLEDGGNIDDGLKWQIIFTGYEGDVPILEASVVSLIGGKTGTIPTLTITTQVDGSLNQLFEPIPGDILYNGEPYPQLKVIVNEFTAACGTNCNYIIDSSLTPIIDSYSMTSTGLSISLSNTENFPTLSASSLDIKFADSQCIVDSVALPTVICSILKNDDNSLKLSAGEHLPEVEIKEYGFADNSVVGATQIPLTIGSILPATGSPNGGQDLTITGSGFGKGIEIMLGSVPVTKILSITNTEIIIMTPHSDASQNSTIQLTLNGQTISSSSYSFLTTGLPTITSLSKTTASPMIKSNVVAYGSGFGTEALDLRCILQNINDDSIYFELNVYSAEDSEVMCILGGGIQGDYSLNIIKAGFGYALVNPEGANLFKFQIIVTDYQPKFMGIYTGSKLTITGSGFSSVLAQNTITIGDPNIYCKVVSASSTELVCELAQDVTEEYLATPQQFHVLQRISEQAVCDVDGGCELTFIEPFLDCFEILNE